VNALASGAITANNKSTPLPDKLVSLAHRITATDIGTGWSSWHQAGSTSSPESRSRSMAAWTRVSGSSLWSRRLLRSFWFNRLSMWEIICYMSSGCHLVRLSY